MSSCLCMQHKLQQNNPSLSQQNQNSTSPQTNTTLFLEEYPKNMVQTLVSYLYTGTMKTPSNIQYELFSKLLDEYGLLSPDWKFILNDKATSNENEQEEEVTAKDGKLDLRNTNYKTEDVAGYCEYDVNVNDDVRDNNEGTDVDVNNDRNADNESSIHQAQQHRSTSSTVHSDAFQPGDSLEIFAKYAMTMNLQPGFESRKTFDANEELNNPKCKRPKPPKPKFCRVCKQWGFEEIKVHACSKCGKLYRHCAKFRRHMRIHSKERIHCKICNKSFPHNPHYLKVHMRTHSTGNLSACLLSCSPPL